MARQRKREIASLGLDTCTSVQVQVYAVRATRPALASLEITGWKEEIYL
jgi:hypothetical protein